jgi:3-deoxy-D-manno-octulosonic-acid transferase
LIQTFLMKLIYRFSLQLFYLIIRIASLGGKVKARQWLIGRKNIFSTIENALQPNEKRVWFHCASLGEFEQGRPVIEKFKMQNAEFKIVLTFFSPSGYEVRKNYGGVDYVFYLPLDTKSNAVKFISLVNPQKVFFVKYEFWFHYLDTLRKKNIPTFLVSGIFRSQQKFFKWYGSFFRTMLESFTHIFLQDEESAELLKTINIKNYTVAGDTRFDRVVELAKNVQPIPLIEKFKSSSRLIIAGSTWKEDEEIIHDLFSFHSTLPSAFKLIIAPHETNENRVRELLKTFDDFNTGRFSLSNDSNISSYQVLIIDHIGMLSSLYQYGSYAYIGGGFGKGIHNILEAAVFGNPVFFGPNFQKFREAKELVKIGGAFSIKSGEELKLAFNNLDTSRNASDAASLAARNYVFSKNGATEKIISFLKNIQ